jgi:hypothetical protein
MTRCTPKPNPSTTDLETTQGRVESPGKALLPAAKAASKTPLAIAVAPFETVAVWRIKLKTWFGRVDFEREVHKRPPR